MKIVIPKETFKEERRVPMIPADVEKLIKKGAEVEIEAGMGEGSGHEDGAYRKVGAAVAVHRKKMLSEADLVLRLRKPPVEEISWLKEGAIHISHLDPFNEKERIDKFLEAGISAISMEMIPRTARAKKMDALSSQAGLAGYVAVAAAMKQLDKIFPLMVTPAGTIQPSEVFVIGAGVAGMQAIATAKRMGAKVEAFDTRPLVEEQVKSLGVTFAKVDPGETGHTKNGCTETLTDERLKKQQEIMSQHCSTADVVIATAKSLGHRAPIIVTKEMIKNMRKGSVIVDLAVDTGGNVEGSRPNETVNIDGVYIIGLENYPGQVPVHASQMYSSNLYHLVAEYWDATTKSFKLDREDEIIRGCLLTHNHEIVNEMLKKIGR